MLGESDILKDKKRDNDKEGAITEMRGDQVETVIPGDQVQKYFEKSEATGLQGNTEMIQRQWVETIHYTRHQDTGALSKADG